MRSTLCLALVSLVVSAGPVLAQDHTADLAERQFRDFRGKHGLPGKRPGTELWIVHFKNRNFDLKRFRAAVYARRSAAEVNRIVADLDERMVEDQRAFVTKVQRDFGAVVTSQWWIVNGCAIEVDPKHLPKIAAMAKVDFLQPDEAHFLQIKTATNSRNHNADFVHNTLKFKATSDVTVAIVDTGLDSDMRGTKRPHRTFYPDGDSSKQTGSGIGKSRLILNRKIGAIGPDDVHSHGTGVASIACGGKWGSSGADHGHAFGANVAGYAIANQVASGGTTLQVMANAWNQMAKDRVQYKIVCANLSYSGRPQLSSVEQKAMDSAAFNADIMTCTAGGNFRTSTASSQGCANGLATAAITANSWTVASFSSKGPLAGSNGRFFPDVAGCGVSTRMARRDNETADYVASGTSMASPQTCGVAGLVRSSNLKVTALECKSIILATTQSIRKQNPRADRNHYGMGMVRSDLAVMLTRSKQNYGTFTLTSQKKTQRIPIVVKRGVQYAAAVAWHRSNVNSGNYADLNLRILDGSVVLAESKTPRNLYEMTRFLATKTGALILEVTAASLDTTSVDFSYAFTTTPPEPVAGVVTSFGQGCKGQGFPPGAPCQSENQNLTNLANSVFTDKGVDILVQVDAAQDLLVEGFSIRSRGSSSGTAPADQTIGTAIYDANSAGEPNKVLARSSMKLGTAVASYRSLFGQNFSFKKGTRFFLALTVPSSGVSKVALPVAARPNNGTDTPFWVKGFDGVWRSFGNTQWIYQVICKITQPGAVPVLSARNLPVIGQRVTLDVRHARPSVPLLVLTGYSNTTWGGVSLPWQPPGARGCRMFVSLDLLSVFNVNAAGSFTGSYTLPTGGPGLIGETWYHQVVVVDRRNNPFGIATSNALRMQMGNSQ